MTKAEYLQKGESLDYTNATEETVPDGAVVTIGGRIGVTGCPILPGQTGSLHVTGVFEIAKSGSAAVEMGQAVYFDGDGITDTAGEVAAGYAAAPADANAETILVKLCG